MLKPERQRRGNSRDRRRRPHLKMSKEGVASCADAQLSVWRVVTKAGGSEGNLLYLGQPGLSLRREGSTRAGMKECVSSAQPRVWACSNCTRAASERLRETLLHSHTSTLLCTSKAPARPHICASCSKSECRSCLDPAKITVRPAE